MSAPATDIITQVKSLAASTLGATYQELSYIYDVSKNEGRHARLGYGVRPLEAVTVEGVNRCYTLDHGFELILTDTWTGKDDSEITSSLQVMYNQADTIFKALIQTKINLSSVVLNVFSPSLSEPEILEKQRVVVLRMRFLVKYRSALN